MINFKDLFEFINQVKKEHKKPKNRFFEFSSIWKDRDRTQESIREQVWR